MTDSSMNFGPAWIRNLRPEGGTSSSGGGGTAGGSRYQLAEYRYGREEMLALFDKHTKPPLSLTTFKTLYSDQPQVPLALLPNTEEEQRGWQSRPISLGGASRGRGVSLERGGRASRGRGSYQGYGRAASAFDSGWGNGEQPDWSPRKEFAPRASGNDNWRRVRGAVEDEEGWRNIGSSRPLHEKWGRSTSWRGDGDSEERNGPPERGSRPSWHENSRGGPLRRSWDNEDHLPEWATENPTEGGGTFDERGAFHGSDDEDCRRDSKRDLLQKSISQQHIPHKNQLGLSSSKSTTSLLKSDDCDKFIIEENSDKDRHDDSVKENRSPEKDKLRTTIAQKFDKRLEEKDTKTLEDIKHHLSEKVPTSNGPPLDIRTSNIDKVDEDFDRLQEDLVLKLVVDEETPKPTQTPSSFDVTGVQPPPNLAPPSQDKWYYQDPQGTRQGPFANVEMAEWYKAGYFSNQLNVMRECDERYFLLGELISLCGGENPFLSNMRFPVLKTEPAKMSEDVLPYQFLSQMAFKQQVPLRNLTEPWGALTLQQQELAAQRLLLQQQQPQQIPPDLQFMQQPPPPANPLLYMINQMQQNNKLAGSVLVDKPNSSVPSQLDPLLVQMGNMHPLQNRMQTPGLHNHLPGGVPTNISSPLPPDGLGSSLPSLQTPPMATSGMSLPGLHGNLPSGLPNTVNINRPTSSIDQMQGQDNDPITNFLKQFQQQRQLPLDSLWQKQQNQFNVAPTVSTPSQWPQPQQPETPLSMWELQSPSTTLPSEVATAPTEKIIQQEKEKDQRPKEEVSQKELKKRKEQEEKQAKKDAEERRKQEQKKQEAEKKAAEERKKKEEDKIRKELEKAKKEAEEKRLRELEEKRKLKEQRKAEEEARKKSEETKKQEEEKSRRELREREERKQAETLRLAQSQTRGAAKSAPWSQSNFTPGLTLTDIQKAEKEKRAHESALQLQKQQLHEHQQQQQQQQAEKVGGLQLNWAKKPMEPRKVKSFAEIQAEEQERMAKLSAEAKLAAQLKEKEAPVSNVGNIWNGQSLTWANASSTSQWSSASTGGFWDEVPSKSSHKPSTVSKSNSTSAMTTTKQQQQKQSKNKTKKEESPKSVNNNNNQTKDEFTDWCHKTLSNISADVDIPTFVTFLLDIESAYDVREYCKDYLGESAATQQFASNFLEKRRSCKPKNNAHKDDMCMPAPAITPGSLHSTEFQEVKGKNKKNKKSKMLKVDSRILGFNVTSAPDRINVGDRDYGDNS